MANYCLNYNVQSTEVLKYPGGIPASLIKTGQQWDFPNGWAPLNHMIIEGLRNTNNSRLQELGYRIAQEWIRENYHAYKAKTPHRMFEKVFLSPKHLTEITPGCLLQYDIQSVANMKESVVEGMGEYEMQTGFGWTNGVILDLLHTYGDRLINTNVTIAK